eukprot:122681-Amphidinium_carterae.1
MSQVLEDDKEKKRFLRSCTYKVHKHDQMISEKGERTRLERPAEHGSPRSTRGRCLPVLVWHPSKRDINREQHAMNGNTSSTALFMPDDVTML